MIQIKKIRTSHKINKKILLKSHQFERQSNQRLLKERRGEKREETS
jgi:hypothetical protein